jgi:hypothetical protein
MAYEKLQARRALTVIPDRGFDIPDPSSIVNYINDTTPVTYQDSIVEQEGDFTVAGTLTGTAGTKYTEMNIKQGAIIYNTTAQKVYTVVSVDNDTTLSISPSAANGATDRFYIFNQTTIGCTLFVGTAGNVNVKMATQKGVQSAE